MKVKFLFLAILGGLAFCSCNSYGDKYKLSDKHSVYYKGGGVTEDDAKKVGAYFTEIGLFTTENTMDVQISAEKNSNDMKIRYVEAPRVNNPDVNQTGDEK